MNVIFFGTPEFAKEVLSFLLSHRINIVAVVTGEDKPKGRNRQVHPPEVKEFIQSHYPHIPVFQPKKASDPEFVETLKAYNPDLFIVVSYGQLLKQNLLSVPKLFPINVHPSLLPLYRGASPIRSPLLHGDTKTGVTIMEMILEMDAGDILAQEEYCIPDQMVHGELEEHLCGSSCRLLLEVLESLEKGMPLQRRAQEAEQATFSKKIGPEHLLLNFNKPAKEVHSQVRALSPSPGAFALCNLQGKEKRVKVLRTEVTSLFAKSAGENLLFDRVNGWVVSCQDVGIKILEVQPEGGKKMSVKEFMNGVSSAFFITP